MFRLVRWGTVPVGVTVTGRLETMSVNRTHARAGPATGEERVYVIGGGHVGHDIATRLAGEGPPVHVLDCSLPDDLPAGATGDEVPSLDAATLAEADVDEAAAVVVAGRDDAENLLLAQLARSRFGVDRIVVLVNDPRRLPAFETIDVEIVDAAAVLGRAVTERW